MRILGVDYGQTRVGLALSDETGTIALGLTYVPGGADVKVSQSIAEVVAKHDVGLIIVGVPVRLSGQPSPQTERTIQFINAVKERVTVPVERWDERLTTAQAQRVLIEGNVRRRDRREKVDKLAAQLMLQSYLDARNPEPASD